MQTGLKRRWLRVTAIVSMLSLLLFSACGSGEDQKKTGITVAVCGPYIDETSVQSIQESLQGAAGDKPVEVIAVSMGDPEKDPMGATAGIMKLTSMVAAKELDVLLSDFDSAKRNAANEMYGSLEEVLSQEQLASYEGRLITFDKMDEENNPTGEQYPACGIDVSGNEAYLSICGGTSAGVYIVSNTSDLESAKAVMLKMAG